MESIVAKLDAALYPAVCSVNTYLSNYILVLLLVAVGLWDSIKSRFIQGNLITEDHTSELHSLRNIKNKLINIKKKKITAKKTMRGFEEVE